MKYLITLSVALLALPAHAHHPLAGQEMTSFSHGLLSGIGHPLLGFDHLFFVVIMGIAAVYTGRACTAPAGYIAAMLAGCILMTFGIELPAVEPVIGASLLILGCIVLSGRALGFAAAIGLFALAGIFHGAAFGESMAAAESASTAPVLMGYLIGLGVIQYGIAVAAGWFASRVWQATESTAIQTRLAGAVVAGVGLFLTLETLEGMVFSALNFA